MKRLLSGRKPHGTRSVPENLCYRAQSRRSHGVSQRGAGLLEVNTESLHGTLYKGKRDLGIPFGEGGDGQAALSITCHRALSPSSFLFSPLLPEPAQSPCTWLTDTQVDINL